MAFRTIQVELKANVAGFASQMGAAGASVKQFGREANQMARTSHEAVQVVSKVGLVMGGAVAAGFLGAATVAGQFEKQMSAVRAVSGATASEMDRLSEAALAAGASTELAGVSASEAAAAEAELVRAGISVNDVIGGALMGSLSLANAGQLDFAKSAEIAAQAMNIFDLRGRDVTHVADVLAAAANKSASDVAGLGDAMRQGGLVAAQTGLSMEETVAALAAFSDQALIGSDAGTSLKTMLQRLNPQSDEAAGLMEELGFKAYDLQGSFIGLEALAGELETSFGHLSAEQRNAAFSTIFGSDAVRGANVLMSQGAEGIAEYVAAVDDQGAAARMAALQVDNLAGDVEALGGAFETALITTGARANGVLREVVQTATDMVSGFTELPDGIQTVGLGLAGVAASSAAVIGAAGVMIPKIATVTTALQGMGAAGSFAAASLGPAFAAGGALTLGIGLYTSAVGAANREAKEFVATITEDIDMGSVDSIRDGTDEIARQLDRLDAEWEALAGGGMAGDDPTEGLRRGLRGMVEILTPLENSVERNKERTNELRRAQEELTQTSMQLEGNTFELMNRLGLTEEQVKELADTTGVDLAGSFQDVVPALESAHAALQGGSAAAMEMDAATATLSTTVADATERADAFEDALDSLFSSQFSVEQATDALTEQMFDLLDSFALNSDGIAGNTATLDANSRAGLENRDVVRGLIEGVYDLLAAEQRQGATSAELQAILDQEREALRAVLTQLGFNVDEVDRYVGALDRVPIDIGTEVRVTGADHARGLIDGIAGAMQRLQGTGIDVAINAVGALGVRPFAEGGIEDHTAQIAPAGAWRVWAEPETGGEAYIPMAPAKRPRSTSILAEVAGQFGYGLMPLADGGVIRLDFGPSLSAAATGLATVGTMPRGSATGLDAEFLRRFKAYSAEVGPLSITSGFRSSAQQAVLYQRYLNGTGNLAAPPGRSKHERGLAIDHGPRSTPAMRTIARRYRLHYPVPGEPWHVEPFANGGILGNRKRSFADGGIFPGGARSTAGVSALGLLGVTPDASGVQHMLEELNRFAHGLQDVANLTDEATKKILDSELKVLEGLPVYSQAWDDRVRAIQRFEAESQATAYDLLAQRQEFEDNLYTLGVSSTEEYVAQLDRRIAREQAFSSEWTSLVQQRAQVLEQAAQAEREAYEQQVEINNNRFTMGALSLQDHLGNLDRRIAREREFTSEWVALVRQREEVVEEDYQRRVEINNNMFEMGRVSTADHLANLDRRMAREVQYSNEWMSLMRQQEQVREDQARAAEERAERVARNRADFRDRVETRQDNMFELGMVDVDTHLKRLERRLAGEVEFSSEWMAIHNQRQSVLDEVARKEEERQRAAEERRREEEEAERRRQDAIRSRIDEFAGWADVTERASVQWGNSASALTRNITDQVEMFTDWMAELDAAKAAGVSASVIDMLGLDDGPQALGQLRQLTKASKEELAALNQASQVRDAVFQNRAISDVAAAAAAPVVNVTNHISIDGRAVDASYIRAMKETNVATAIAGSR